VRGDAGATSSPGGRIMSDYGSSGPGGDGDDWDPHLGSLLAGIAMGVAMLAAIWLFVAFVSGGDDRVGSPDAVEPSPLIGDTPSTAPQSSDSTGSTDSTGLARCTTAAGLVERPLQLARPALDQWEVHVGAMNKLVVGAITLPQATAFWNQTRVGAYDRIGRFDDAEAELERRGIDCTAPRLLGADVSPAYRACAQHVVAELRALRSARTAIATWKHHMHAMDQLRAGQLSPASATQMWMMMWQRGVDELEAFDAAERTARDTGACGDTVATAQPSAPPSGEPGSSPVSPTESPTSEMSGMDMQ
jgi:hypothetical protein